MKLIYNYYNYQLSIINYQLNIVLRYRNVNLTMQI